MTTTTIDSLRAFLDDRGLPNLIDAGLIDAYQNGTIESFLDERGAGHLLGVGLLGLLADVVTDQI